MSNRAPSLASLRPAWPAFHPLGVLLGALAGVRHATLMTRATNDNFLHLTLAQQWLAGDWPVRDFYEGGWVLQYALSAAAHLVLGNRLIGETLVVAMAWAVATSVVFAVVRRLTSSVMAATLGGIVPILAAARGYSYPKGIVYAVAAALWWNYVAKPTVARAVGFGAWGAMAFYWRPDHGVYVAAGILLAMWAAHGFSTLCVRRCLLAGGTMLGFIAPFLIYVQVTVGLPDYMETGIVQGRVEHTTQGPHAWPILRFGRRVFSVEPAGDYAPAIGVRWSPGSAPENRRDVLRRYGLSELTVENESLSRVRLSEETVGRLRALINEPIVEDTTGIDRSTGVLSPPWPAWQRWTYRQPWLRVRILPDLQKRDRASEIVVALFYVLPIVVAGLAPLIARQLPGVVSGRAVVAFAGFAFLLDLAMLRMPFAARAFDAAVLPAILFGCCIASICRPGPSRASMVLLRAAAIAAVVLTLGTVARAGEFVDSVNLLARGWSPTEPAGGPFRELVASPPLSHYLDRPARFSLRLAAYVRDCVPASERLLVLWFEPEIYYYSERLMAQRHLVFATAWANLDHEQRTTLEKVRRFAPPLALARRSALEEYARITYPGLVDYVEREYRLAATVDDAGEQYLIFTRRDRPLARRFGPHGWPCFTPGPSRWARVGASGS